MSGVGIGIGVDHPQPAHASPQAAIRIATGGVLPGAMALTEGQTGHDLPAVWFDPANYDAPGTVTAALRVNGAPAPLDAVFQTGDRVALHVSDDQATRPLTSTIDENVEAQPLEPPLELTGLLSDQSIVIGAGTPAYDASIGFAGPVASYALVTAPAGVAIDAATGLIDFSGLTTPVTDAPVTVRATTADLQGAEDGFLLTAVASDISATVPPAMSPLYEGQAVRDVAGYATMTDPANFASNAGAIAGTQVAATGDALAPDSALVEGDSAGFAVTVTDSSANERIFTANPITVQYKARITETVDNEAEIDINPLVPDSDTISLTFSGTEYDGTYTPTAGDIRNGIYNFEGTVEIEHEGEEADLTIGSILTADPGLWTSPGGNDITFTYQWKRDGANISGATSATHDLVADDIGAALTCAVTAADGVAANVTATTKAVNPPASSLELTGLLSDQSIIIGAGTPAYDTSIGFVGPVASYTLVMAPAGVAIEETTGLVDFSGLTTPVTDATVIVRATTADLQGAEDSFLLTAVASEISATVLPTMSPLYEGQAVRDVAGYAAMTDPANFTSNAGAIAGTQVAATGDALAPDSALVEGDMAGFAVTVTDSSSHEQTFTASPVTVQYKVRITTTAGNEAEIDINPMVPDSETISLTFSGTEYDGTYTPTAGQIRNGIHNFAGTAHVEHAGSEADLVTGSTLTVDPGLWSSPSGATLAFSFQWRRNGADIAGATGESHVLGADDIGAALTCVVTASDGMAADVTTTTGAVNPPAATSVGEAPTHLHTNFVAGQTHSVNLAGLNQGDEIYFIAHIAMGTSETNRIADLTVNGGTVVPALIVNDNSRNQVAVGKFTVGAAWGTITISVNGASAGDSSALTLFKANGWTGPSYAVDNGAAGTTLVETIIPVLSGDHVLASATDSGRSPAPSLSGVTTITGAASPSDPTYHVTAGAQAIPADNAAYAVQATLPLGSQMALGTIRLTT